MDRTSFPTDEDSRLRRTADAAKEWGKLIVFLLFFLAVGLPLSIAVVNWVYGIPEHVVWFFETTRTDVWIFWIANVTGGVNETPWWW